MPAPPFLEQCRPPWIAFPELNPNELAGFLRQGATEAYFYDLWRPFWESLDAGQRAHYLDHWNASPEWREAIHFHFEEDPDFDAEADMRESKEYLERRRTELNAKSSARPWWARLLRRKY